MALHRNKRTSSTRLLKARARATRRQRGTRVSRLGGDPPGLPVAGRSDRRRSSVTLVKGGKKVRKDTKTHQDRYLAIDPVTCTLIQEHLAVAEAALAGTGVKLTDDAYLFSNQPANTRPWNPDWATHRVADLAGRPESSSTSRQCGTTPPASSSPPASTWETPLPGSATPAAAPPPSGTTPTRYPRSTAEPPPTLRSSLPLGVAHRDRIANDRCQKRPVGRRRGP